ncbi:AMP-binding protein [Mangrovimonas spongiae]|uniref:O-succinylbenzoic acid--CoA ligase n=1 Tax=Mangrovimonas spongiae TaxID=2494697 RepID=A0A428JX60_9FLAO|nr:AMP-binding protein [Mangrovimonas spongiae]RSK38767.1 O-succinylbenzoic acid--CoA ligase [Mangrovimonas spongiae]
MHPSFKLNGIHFSAEALKEVSYSYIKEGEDFEKQIGHFLLEWLDHNAFINLKTSGSTGKPKLIKMDKQAMVNSAIATGRFFNLSAGKSALLCLPSNYIAGKMMLVRAMVLGLDLTLINPKIVLNINPKKEFDFCAMIPMQVEKNLNKLTNIKTLIVGGAAVSRQLEEKIKPLNTHVYATYGMTETVSHIALKKLNHTRKKAFYKLLPNISIKQDDRECLIINAPKLTKKEIITNDIVKLHSNKTFEWLGRFDNVINSGGIKLIPEPIEAKLQQHISERFFIASLPDDHLGEKLVLIIEGNEKSLPKSTFKQLDKLQQPKEIFFVDKFIETNSGKVQREQTLKLIN